jgi:hypothetical protein
VSIISIEPEDTLVHESEVKVMDATLHPTTLTDPPEELATLKKLVAETPEKSLASTIKSTKLVKTNRVVGAVVSET